jgi:hypothetical protein
MANIYESDDFNIVSVYEKAHVEDYDDGTSETSIYFIVKVQRIPVEQYPQLTDIYIFSDELSPTVSKEEFLSAAPSIIISKLSDFDSTFTGEEAVLAVTNDLTQKFTD